MNIFVGVEGFTTPSGFIVKELCFLNSNMEFDHLLMKPPGDMLLTEVDRKTIRYTTRHLNSLNYHDGVVPYGCLDEIISKYRECKVYTYSNAATELLRRAMPTTIIFDCQQLGMKMPKELPDPKCFRLHSFRYCAKAKSIAIKNFVEK